MAFKFSGEHIDSYYRDGFCIFRDLVPPSLLRDLRRMAEQGRVIAHERGGPQAQRLQPIQQYLDIKPYEKLAAMPELADAISRILDVQCRFGFWEVDGEKKSQAGILYEPCDMPWCTLWHRDWRDNVAGMDIDKWQERIMDAGMFNQVNCALYEDTCTWVVPGSHLRRDLPAEIERFPQRPTSGPTLADDMTPEAREAVCLDYTRSMPGAAGAHLNSGDFMLYRNSLWHLGNYVPYKRRATLHDGVWTDTYWQWFNDWPKRPDGKTEMANPNLDTPEYKAWKRGKPAA